MKMFLTLPAAALLFCLPGCSGISIAGAWKANDPDVRPLRKIMVMAVSGSDSLDAAAESRMARHLRYLGYDAVSKSAAYGRPASEAGNEAATMERMAADSIDAILTIALLNWKAEKKAMPEDLWCSPYNNYNRLFWCYEAAIGGKVAAPGYYEARAPYIWEFNFYRAADQQLRYCVRTRKARLMQARSNVGRFSDLVLSDMVWQKVLSRRSRN